MLLDTILHFDIAALFIFAITIFYVLYRKSYKAYSSMNFLILNILYFIVCILDILVSSNKIPLNFEKIGMFLYYLFKYIASIIFLYYLILITDSVDVLKNKKIGILLFVPFLVTIVFLITNIFTGHIYYYEDGNYFRGKYIFVFYSLSFIYVIIGMIWIFRFIKAFRINEIFAILSVYVLSIAALLVQFFNEDVLIEILSSSISFVLLSITLERSQIIVDQRTGLKNIDIFNKTMFITFKRNKEKGLILLYVKNYLSLFGKYNYDIALKNIRSMTTYLSKVFLNDVVYDCYYLGNGFVGIVTKTYEDTKKLGVMLNDTLENSASDERGFNIDYILCALSIPTDIDSVEGIEKIKANITNLQVSNKIIYLSDLNNDKNLEMAFDLDNILNNAIKNDNIEVYYQPIFNLKDKKYYAVEVYTKIKDDKYGLIDANKFIMYAEDRNKLYDIDMLTIDKAYRFFKEANLESLGLKYIAFNVSAKTFINHSFLTDLDEIESKYNLREDAVYFEIKERGGRTFIPEAFVTINNLMKDGYLFTLDNYGMGCMPIINLAKVPFLSIKFDKSFAECCKKEETNLVIGRTIKLLRELDKLSVCTGIETKEIADVIERLNPDFVQGYYYSKPLSGKELVEFLKNNN